MMDLEILGAFCNHLHNLQPPSSLEISRDSDLRGSGFKMRLQRIPPYYSPLPKTHGPLLRTPKGDPECHSVHRQFQRSAFTRQQRNVKEKLKCLQCFFLMRSKLFWVLTSSVFHEKNWFYDYVLIITLLGRDTPHAHCESWHFPKMESQGGSRQFVQSCQESPNESHELFWVEGSIRCNASNSK